MVEENGKYLQIISSIYETFDFNKSNENRDVDQMVSINYEKIQECIDIMDVLSHNLYDLLKEFDMKTKFVLNTPYLENSSFDLYKNNCECIKQNIMTSYDVLNEYKNILYNISNNYSKIDSDIQTNEMDL